MSSDALPEPGGVEVEPESDAAATVEELARAGVWLAQPQPCPPIDCRLSA